jgi:hypothetical protein
MSAHTPGPWKIDGRGYRPDTKNGGEFVPIHAERGGWIADVREPDANARLIAAAPKMFELLEKIEADILARENAQTIISRHVVAIGWVLAKVRQEVGP